VGRVWPGFIWLKIEFKGSFLCHGNEPSGYAKGEEYFDQLSDIQLLWKDSSPWS
jgi:hypothetical protein